VSQVRVLPRLLYFTRLTLANVVHNEAHHRFEVVEGDSLAVALYQREGSLIIFTHTEVPKEFEGKGVGSALAKTALNYARDNDLKVLPLCPFIRSYIERHAEYQPLVTKARFKD
jgi:predicted GNAT family acetyltransferase